MSMLCCRIMEMSYYEVRNVRQVVELRERFGTAWKPVK